MFDAKHLLVIIACLRSKVKIKNHLILDDFPKYNLDWYRWWDSNPHGFPLDFESSASTIPPHRRNYFIILAYFLNIVHCFSKNYAIIFV